MNADKKWFDETIAELKRPVEIDQEAKASIMEKVRGLPCVADSKVESDERVGWWRWLNSRRIIRLSPIGLVVYTIMIASVVIAIVHLPGPDTRPSETDLPSLLGNYVSEESGALVTGPVWPDRHPVRFVLVAPSASRVSVVGDFNNWNKTDTPLRQEGTSGLWSVVVPLSEGRHVYAFVVDDETWLLDENSLRAPADEFGNTNSVILVGGG